MLTGQPPSVDPAVSVISVPGSEESYSNPGYSIIQKLLKDVQNDSFENILDQLVLKPSGMVNSSFQQPIPARLGARRAIGYNNQLKPYVYKIFPYMAAGGLWTTPEDLANFVITVFGDYEGKAVILSREMAHQVLSHDRERLAFAKIVNDRSDDLIFRHYGSNQGFTCYVVGSLKNRQALIAMTNSDNGFALLDYLARATAEHYKWDYLQPEVFEPVELDPEEMIGFQGRFNHNAKILQFTQKDDSLWVSSEGEEAQAKLTPVRNSTFINPVDSVMYKFLKNRTGDIKYYKWCYIVEASGSENYAPRVE